MNKIHYIIFLFFLLSKPAFLAINRVDIVSLKDGRQLVSLGDNHAVGTYEENLKQAYMVFDLIDKFNKKNPHKEIMIFPESLLYSDEKLSLDDIEAIMAVNHSNDNLSIVRGRKIGSNFILESIKKPFPTWIDLSSPLMMPILYKLSSMPNVSILPVDPRNSAVRKEYLLNYPIIDITDLPRSFIDRYWKNGWKKDLPKEYHSYFKKHAINLPKHIISTYISDLSNILNTDEDSLFTKIFNNIPELDRIKIVNSVDNINHSIITINPELNTLYEPELLYHTLINNNKDKVLFFFIGAYHSRKLITALNNFKIIDSVKTINDNNLYKIINDTARELDIRLFDDVYISESFNNYIKNNSKNNSIENIKTKIIKFYNKNPSSRFNDRYSLLGRLITYYDIIKTALETGADPNIIEPDGKTPVIRLLTNMLKDDDYLRYEKILELLIEHKANTFNPEIDRLLKALKSKIPSGDYPKILLDIENSNKKRKDELSKKGYILLN